MTFYTTDHDRDQDTAEETSFATDTLSRLSGMTREEFDELDFGVVRVDDAGRILLYNRYESELSGLAVPDAEGKNFFTQVAPCTDNSLFFGAFKHGVKTNHLNYTFGYTFSYKMKPTNVKVHLYRDVYAKTNWVLVQKNA